MRTHKQTFFVNKFVDTKIVWEPVEGYPARLKGFRAKFFLAKTGKPSDLYHWTLYEVKTGCSLAEGQTCHSAMYNALAQFKRLGITSAKMTAAIKEFTKTWGENILKESLDNIGRM